MKASREKQILEISRVMSEIMEKSIRIDGYGIEFCGKGIIKLEIYDPYAKVIDFTKGTPYDVLCVAKSWLYSLLH